MAEKTLNKGEQKLEVKKARAICYRVYDYLKDNHIGRQHSITAENLARKFAISKRDLREVLTEINVYPMFDKIVCRNNYGIYIAENQEEALSYISTARHRGIAILYEAYKCSQKHSRAGQEKIPFGQYYSEYCKTYEENNK